jgi:hypothetical protein
VLLLDAEGDIDLGGRPKAMAVWNAMNEAIEDLPKLVAEVLRGEAAPEQNFCHVLICCLTSRPLRKCAIPSPAGRASVLGNKR